MVMQKPTAHRAVGFWRTYVSWSMCITSFIVIFLFGFVFFVAAFHKLLKSHPVNQKILLLTVTFALFPYCHFCRSFRLFIINPRAPRGARRSVVSSNPTSRMEYLVLLSTSDCGILSPTELMDAESAPLVGVCCVGVSSVFSCPERLYTFPSGASMRSALK